MSLAIAACVRRAPVGGTVAVLADRDVEGLDPHTSGQVWQTQNVLLNAYEPLVGVDGMMSVTPALAVSWSSPDELTWDFVLRSDVAFQTGGTLTSDDVVFSLRRARDHTRSVSGTSLAGVKEIAARGPDRVRLTTSVPDPLLATKLRDVFVVSHDFVGRSGEEALERVSAGTGPFRIVKRDKGSLVTLERFDRHWKGRPSLDRVLFVARTFGDPSTATIVPKEARLVFWVPPGSALFESSRRDYTLHITPSLSVTYLGFDLRSEEPNPFRDPEVRSAVACAIDPQAFLAADAGTAASQFVPPGVFGFDPALPPLRRDVAEGLRHLSRSRYPKGFDVVLDVRKMQDRYAAPIVSSLQALGIRARFESLAESDFFAKLRAGRSALYVLRFSCRSGDAQEFLDAWLHSRDETRGFGLSNFSYSRSPLPGADEEIDAARRESSPVLRAERLRKIMRRAVESRVAIPLFFNADVTFVSKDLDWKPRADTFRTFGDAKIRDR